MENSSIYRSTDRGRNPIWLLSHYITVFVVHYNFVGKRGKGTKKKAEWDARELFRIKDDLFFYILFDRNIPLIFADVVVVIVVVVVLNTVSGVFPLSSKRMDIQIIIANIIRTTRIIKIINHIVFLFRKCSHLEETRSFFTIYYYVQNKQCSWLNI
jgi:hypothetical protein